MDAFIFIPLDYQSLFICPKSLFIPYFTFSFLSLLLKGHMDISFIAPSFPVLPPPPSDYAPTTTSYLLYPYSVLLCLLMHTSVCIMWASLREVWIPLFPFLSFGSNKRFNIVYSCRKLLNAYLLISVVLLEWYQGSEVDWNRLVKE